MEGQVNTQRQAASGLLAGRDFGGRSKDWKETSGRGFRMMTVEVEEEADGAEGGSSGLVGTRTIFKFQTEKEARSGAGDKPNSPALASIAQLCLLVPGGPR